MVILAEVQNLPSICYAECFALEISRDINKPGDFGGNAHRVQGDIGCKVLVAVFNLMWNWPNRIKAVTEESVFIVYSLRWSAYCLGTRRM